MRISSTMGTVMPTCREEIVLTNMTLFMLTRMAVLSGSVEMGWLQAVSLNLSPPV